ncbi:hypothetical protein [Pseudooceanicola sp. C21-150M6]|uniref:hypothetical protein n=1 Tax=Pseudooceanicola sp. C21-150M6 TaxID=3434355 RepID=UPI003D7F4A3D
MTLTVALAGTLVAPAFIAPEYDPTGEYGRLLRVAVGTSSAEEAHSTEASPAAEAATGTLPDDAPMRMPADPIADALAAGTSLHLTRAPSYVALPPDILTRIRDEILIKDAKGAGAAKKGSH